MIVKLTYNQKVYIANGFADILRHLRMSESKTCDLSNFPAEVSLKVLKYLNATGIHFIFCSLFYVSIQIFRWPAVSGPNWVLTDLCGRICAGELGKSQILFTKTNLKAGRRSISCWTSPASNSTSSQSGDSSFWTKKSFLKGMIQKASLSL